MGEMGVYNRDSTVRMLEALVEGLGSGTEEDLALKMALFDKFFT